MRADFDVDRRESGGGAPAGWAESVGEREAGVASVSAPVRDAGRSVVAAISVSGPADRLGRAARAAGWAAAVQAAAARQLGSAGRHAE